MRVDIEGIDRERFHVNERTIPGLGDFVLIVPFKAMWAWKPGEEHLRSLLCRPDGTIVSAGFPKFRNFSEDPETDRIVTEGLAKGNVACLEKLDGSLIIRSVIDGRVHLRTRGCEVVASDMREEVERTVRDRYPKLLDPSWHVKQHSLLMEFVSPRNQIVVRYDEPRLYELGYSDWSRDRLLIRAAPDCANGFDLEVPRVIDLPRDISGMRAIVTAFGDQEGIVAWTRRDDWTYHLCKFKSAWYMRLHALRSAASPRYIREFCYLGGIRTLDGLKEALLREGFDWEVCQYLEPMFEEFRAQAEEVERMLSGFDDAIETQLKRLPRRKDVAAAAAELAGTDGGPRFGYIMSKATGDEEKAGFARDAMRTGFAINQLRQLKKRGMEPIVAADIELD